MRTREQLAFFDEILDGRLTVEGLEMSDHQRVRQLCGIYAVWASLMRLCWPLSSASTNRSWPRSTTATFACSVRGTSTP
jgi:hypothetical protein